MRIEDPKLLAEFRGPGLCEFCGLPCRNREAAHVLAKGMDAGKQLDIRENLISLGGPFDCACHQKSHNGGQPKREQLLSVIAWREGTTADRILEFLYQVRRLDKGAGSSEVQRLRESILGAA